MTSKMAFYGLPDTRPSGYQLASCSLPQHYLPCPIALWLTTNCFVRQDYCTVDVRKTVDLPARLPVCPEAFKNDGVCAKADCQLACILNDCTADYTHDAGGEKYSWWSYFSCFQVLGAPTCCFDCDVAWAPPEGVNVPQWLDVSFAQTVVATSAIVVENCIGGFVTSIDAFVGDRFEPMWMGNDPNINNFDDYYQEFVEFQFSRPVMTNRLRVNIRTNDPDGYNEIDAIILVSAAVSVLSSSSMSTLTQIAGDSTVIIEPTATATSLTDAVGSPITTISSSSSSSSLSDAHPSQQMAPNTLTVVIIAVIAGFIVIAIIIVVLIVCLLRKLNATTDEKSGERNKKTNKIDSCSNSLFFLFRL